jgi:hypothetical protein
MQGGVLHFLKMQHFYLKNIASKFCYTFVTPNTKNKDKGSKD